MRINKVLKIAATLSERMMTPRETLSRAASAATQKGVTRLADITGLDRIGIPVFAAVVPKSDDTISVYNGKGYSALDARTGALMESIERQTALNTNLKIVSGSYDRLRLSMPSVIDPRSCNQRLRDDYSSDQPFWWMWGYDLIAKEMVLVPAVLAGYGPRFLKTGCPFISFSSNGLASGNCLEEAVCHALCELVERDAWTLADLRCHWLPKARRQASSTASGLIGDDCNAYPRINLAGAEWPISELMGKFEHAGLRPVVRDISSGLGVTCVIASVTDDCIPGFPQAHSGLGAHLCARIAVIRALTELAQSRVVDIQGMREDILPAEAISRGHERHTQRMKEVDHSSWMLRSEGGEKRFADMPSVQHDDIAEDIRLILSGLVTEGIERAIVVDLTEPGGVAVVRVIVPGLEFWVMDQGKLGTRALQFWKHHASVH